MTPRRRGLVFGLFRADRGLGRYRWLLPPLVLIAFAGFAATAALHVVATLRPDEAWSLLGLVSFPVMFPVWGVAVVEARRLGREPGPERDWDSGFSWSRSLRGLRRWEAITAGVVGGALALVTAVRFLDGAAHTGHVPGKASMPYPASFFPTAFFGMSALLLLSAWRVPPPPVKDDDAANP